MASHRRLDEPTFADRYPQEEEPPWASRLPDAAPLTRTHPTVVYLLDVWAQARAATAARWKCAPAVRPAHGSSSVKPADIAPRSDRNPPYRAPIIGCHSRRRAQSMCVGYRPEARVRQRIP